ncbi:MAG TPA: cytochrome c [Noviherbaspirillum sp.]
MKKALGTFAVAALLIAAAALVFVYSGWYNVAASEPHTRATRVVLEAVMENSVKARADGIRAPENFTREMARQGAGHYAEYCVMCHGAPGVQRGELGAGLTPRAPELSKAATGWTPAEMFWITKHGIKMTGMPAWGVSHSDEELWHVVAFVTLLPQLSADEYKTMTAEAGGHRHH